MRHNLAPRQAALGQLMSELHTRTEDGETIPCLNRERGHLWLSEDEAEQEAAMHGCARCPALQACGIYDDAYPETAGVWAARPPRTHRLKESS